VWAQAADQWEKDQVSELGKTLSKLCCYIAVSCFHVFFLGEVFQREVNTIKVSSFLKREKMYQLCEWREILYIVLNEARKNATGEQRWNKRNWC